MNHVIDSSAWIEFFIGSNHAQHFSKVIKNLKKVYVPTISIYEVLRLLSRKISDKDAFKAIMYMRQANIVDLNFDIAIEAAKIANEHKLAMADSTIYATAKLHKAQLWTLDSDFSDLPNVKYFKK